MEASANLVVVRKQRVAGGDNDDREKGPQGIPYLKAIPVEGGDWDLIIEVPGYATEGPESQGMDLLYWDTNKQEIVGPCKDPIPLTAASAA